MSDTPELEITVDRLAEADVIRVAGELDMATVARLERVVGSTTASHVVLDLEKLSYLDSAGLRALDLAYARLAREHRTFMIVASRESRAGWTFRVAGFGDALVVETLEAGLTPHGSG